MVAMQVEMRSRNPVSTLYCTHDCTNARECQGEVFKSSLVPHPVVKSATPGNPFSFCINSPRSFLPSSVEFGCDDCSENRLKSPLIGFRTLSSCGIPLSRHRETRLNCLWKRGGYLFPWLYPPGEHFSWGDRHSSLKPFDKL